MTRRTVETCGAIAVFLAVVGGYCAYMLAQDQGGRGLQQINLDCPTSRLSGVDRVVLVDNEKVRYVAECRGDRWVAIGGGE